MKRIVYIISLFWILITLGFVLSQETIRLTGETIYLETTPIDPIDLLRGNYVDLDFKISTITVDDKSPI